MTRNEVDIHGRKYEKVEEGDKYRVSEKRMYDTRYFGEYEIDPNIVEAVQKEVDKGYLADVCVQEAIAAQLYFLDEDFRKAFENRVQAVTLYSFEFTKKKEDFYRDDTGGKELLSVPFEQPWGRIKRILILSMWDNFYPNYFITELCRLDEKEE